MKDDDRSYPDEAPGTEEGGAEERERDFADVRFARLRERTEEDQEDTSEAPADEGEEGRPPQDDEGAPDLPADFRLRLVDEYRRRQAEELERRRDVDLGTDRPEPPQPPGPAPTNNWTPIGPTVMRRGQSSNRPAVSGRVAGMAVAPGGTRVYVAAAVGGVFRSDDGGASWRSTMEAWDLDPTTAGAATLACGAIALHPANPDRVYLGTGEGPRSISAYFGVGPVRSDTGGDSWVVEATAAGSPTMAGQGFFDLAVDPGDGDRVVAATTGGLYRREPGAGGAVQWARKRTGRHSGVAAGRSGGTTTFYAAAYGGGVVRSSDGDTWTPLATGFPTADVGRIGVATRPTDPSVAYALVARASDSGLLGLWRFDAADSTWRQVSGAPADLFGTSATGFQGWYDLDLTVDENDVNLVYLGGSLRLSGGQWCGAIYRCPVSASGAGASLAYSTVPSYIGARTHGDVHALTFTPGSSTQLWAGTDGGVFVTADAAGAATFDARNVGLMTLTMNHLATHPTEDAVLFAGTQDNGTARYTGEECWLHSAAGDGGFAVVDWNNPYRVLRTYVRGVMHRATDGGADYSSWVGVSLPSTDVNNAQFYAPLAGTPRNPAAPAEADTVAFGGRRPWISTTFGGAWQSIPANTASDALLSNILSLAFASANRLYTGTVGGQVHRFDRSGTMWARAQISAPPLLVGPVTDIAVDLADATGSSIYVTLGGTGDARHLWHYDGTAWTARSGSGGTGLLDVVHNAVVVDPADPARLYVGADIGVWTSADSGGTWTTLSPGLPDAPVIDLDLHESRRLLWAATHGRGVYELALDTATAPGVELYIRDTQLDRGRRGTDNGLPDPTAPGRTVRHWAGPGIKVDAPTPALAYQTPTNQLNFYEFTDLLVDESANTATADPSTPVVNRVYVQVHNRGRQPAHGVRVMLLVANASMGLPNLPPGYDASVRGGTAITTPQWRTVGISPPIDGLLAGYPRIVPFDLPSSLLPPPTGLAGNRHHCLLALVHCPTADEFVNGQVVVDLLSPGERKAAHKNLEVVAITVGPAPIEPGAWHAIDVNGVDEAAGFDVVVQAGTLPGQLRLLVPPGLEVGDVSGFDEVAADDVHEFADAAISALRRWAGEGLYDAEWTERRIEALAEVVGQPAFAVRDGEAVLRDVRLGPEEARTLFFTADLPEDLRIGDRYDIRFEQRSRRKIVGGSTYRFVAVPGPDTADGVRVDTWGERTDDAETVWLSVDRGSSAAEVVLYLHTPAGLHAAPQPMAYDAEADAYALRVDRLPHLAVGTVRFTAVIRTDGTETRRTATVEF